MRIVYLYLDVKNVFFSGKMGLGEFDQRAHVIYGVRLRYFFPKPVEKSGQKHKRALNRTTKWLSR